MMEVELKDAPHGMSNEEAWAWVGGYESGQNGALQNLEPLMVELIKRYSEVDVVEKLADAASRLEAQFDSAPCVDAAACRCEGLRKAAQRMGLVAVRLRKLVVELYEMKEETR
jgi:hypothetical protein